MPMMHEIYRPVAMLALEGGGGATSDYVKVSHANWITIVITEDNLSGAGTAHTWSVTAATAEAGTNTAVMTTGVRVWSETAIPAGTLVDTLAEATVTSGLFNADVTASTWSVHFIEIDPAALGLNATDGLQNDWIALVQSVDSDATNAHAVVYIDQKYKEALGGPTAVA